MKKYLLFFVVLFISLCNYQTLFSTDWESYFPYPCKIEICPDAPIIDTSWYGPYEYDFCLNTIDDYENYCYDSSCCFKIIYYDLTHHHHETYDSINNIWVPKPDHYAVFVSAILTTNCTDCENCDSVKIAELFFREFVKCKLNPSDSLYDPDFLNLDSLPDVNPPYPVWFITGGHCRQIANFDSLCSSICCWSIFNLYVNRNTLEFDSLPKILNSQPIYNTCDNNPNNCIAYCNEIVFQEWNENCCDSIAYTAMMIDSTCCIRLNIYNPNCYLPAPRIVFQQYDTETDEYVTEDSIICPMGETVSYVMCPTNGNKFVKSRILIDNSDSPGVPNCPPDSGYLEGKTMFTSTFDLSSCCSCDSLLKNDWVNIELISNDPECDSNCKVTVSFNIPDSITCYQKYVVEDLHTIQTTIRDIEIDSTYTFCIGEGEFGTIKIYLLQDSIVILDSACKIEKGIACDTIECCPENHNDWLTVNVYKDDSCGVNNCKVDLDWANRDSMSCYKYYFLKINGEPINSYYSSDIDLFPISNHSYCIDSSETSIIDITLYNEDYEENSTCSIQKIVGCPFTYTPLCSLTCKEPWHTVDSTGLIQLDNGCTIKVFFTYRTDCPNPPLGNWQQLFILYIDYNYDSCGNYTPQQLFNEAFDWLVQENPMGFDPVPGDTGCYETWKIGVISCWRAVNPGYGYRPCIDSACCEQIIKVCRDVNNVVTYETIHPLMTWDSLDGCEPYPQNGFFDQFKCYFICTWLDSLSGIIGPNQGIMEPHLVVIDSSLKSNIFAAQYINGILYVSLNSNCGEKMKIDISDVFGIKWLTFEQLSITEKLNFKIDTRVLNKGYYVYKIYCNGYYFGSGKFIAE